VRACSCFSILFGHGIERGGELFKFVAAGDGYAGLKLTEGNTTGGLLELGKWHEIATNLNKPAKQNDPDSQEEYQEEAGGEAHEGSGTSITSSTRVNSRAFVS